MELFFIPLIPTKSKLMPQKLLFQLFSIKKMYSLENLADFQVENDLGKRRFAFF